MKSLLVCAVMTFAFLSHGQMDSLVLLTGKTMKLEISKISAENILYNAFYNKKLNKIEKSGSIDGYRVFAVYQNGEKSVLYKKDTIIGNYRSVQEMNSFILGQQHAMNYYSPKPFFYTGIGLGIGSVLYNTYLSKRNAQVDQDYGFFKSTPGFFPLLTTFTYTIIAGIPPVTLKTSTIKKTYLLQDLDFLDGYERVGRTRKLFGALKGKLLGVGIGLASYLIFR